MTLPPHDYCTDERCQQLHGLPTVLRHDDICDHSGAFLVTSSPDSWCPECGSLYEAEHKWWVGPTR